MVEIMHIMPHLFSQCCGFLSSKNREPTPARFEGHGGEICEARSDTSGQQLPSSSFVVHQLSFLYQCSYKTLACATLLQEKVPLQ